MEPYSLDEYQSFEFDDGRWARRVFRRGTGPGVIVIHEIPGLHPLVVRFANRVAAAGMTVYLPSLFGKPGRESSMPYILQSTLSILCIRREFAIWALDRSSPIVDWLRALAQRVHGECGGPGVGALGMCLTGNFALAMMTEPAVVAPVLSQPSLPLGKKGRGALGLSPAEIDCARRRLADEDVTVIGLRFRHDPLVPCERFDTLRETFGDRFEEIAIDPKDAQPGAPGKPHSVLTIHLHDDDPDGPTRRAERRVIAFFAGRLGVAADAVQGPAA
jgi:dienelactone hydrolase